MRKGIVPAILAGGLAAAVLDLIVACTLSGLPLGVIGKVIARGWFGRWTAMHGGLDVTIIGLGTHVAILLFAAALYVAAAARSPRLSQLWYVAGPLYGAAIFAVMRFVVLPLSAAGFSMPNPPTLYWEIAGHLFLVGAPIAFAARWFMERSSATP